MTVIEGSSVSGHSLLNWPQKVSWPPAEDKQRSAETQTEDREATSQGHGAKTKGTERLQAEDMEVTNRRQEDSRQGHGGNTQRTERQQAEDMEVAQGGQRGHEAGTWRQHTGNGEAKSRGH